DDWGDAARQALSDLPAQERTPRLTLLAHAHTAGASKPSAAWLAAARARVDALGEERFRALVIAGLGLLQGPGAVAYPKGAGKGALVGLDYVPRAVPTDRNATLLKGLAWCCTPYDDEGLARAVASAAEATFKKLPEVGSRSTKVGNACLYALGAMPGPHGGAHLARLQRQLKQPSARARLDATMDASASRRGLTRAELEDTAIPTHGLEAGGSRMAV